MTIKPDSSSAAPIHDNFVWFKALLRFGAGNIRVVFSLLIAF